MFEKWDGSPSGYSVSGWHCGAMEIPYGQRAERIWDKGLLTPASKEGRIKLILARLAAWPTRHPLLLQIARLRQFRRFCDTRKLFFCSCCIEDLEFNKNIEERYEIEKTKLGEGGKVVGTPLCTRAKNQNLWPDRTRPGHVEIRKLGIWRFFCMFFFL